MAIGCHLDDDEGTRCDREHYDDRHYTDLGKMRAVFLNRKINFRETVDENNVYLMIYDQPSSYQYIEQGVQFKFSPGGVLLSVERKDR